MAESSGFITLSRKDRLNAHHQWKDGEIVNTSVGPCEVRIDYNGGIELLRVPEREYRIRSADEERERVAPESE